ncbi:hypothetical protein [Streptomyces sp. I05A-00742]|uniref:hypothetical protein n=1 Tax=Streptomyces sp. I05A-00742 TaxID=2732853 RepID=UPI001488717B|nr:hypothetical protein [Streptomyces sp. I05A-00742]
MTTTPEDTPDADVPRWMNVVSVTADLLLTLFKSAGRRSGGNGGGTSDSGDD